MSCRPRVLAGGSPTNRLGVASSFIAIVRSLGQSLGAAMATTIVTASLLAASGVASIQGLQGRGVLDQNSPLLLGFVQGYRLTHTVAALLCLLGIASSLIRGRERNRAGRL